MGEGGGVRTIKEKGKQTKNEKKTKKGVINF
jgi:hypothetical protein